MRALTNPVRRRLYEVVADAGQAVGRDQAAAAAGTSRSLAAYHLDRLVDHGLLEASYSRPDARGGPGAGRPAKLYRRSRREFELSVPRRDYRLLSELLVRAAAEEGGAVNDALQRVAHEYGRDLAHEAREQNGSALPGLLRTCGYEPFEDERGTWRLRNCPFEAVAVKYPEVVCSLNLRLVEGILEGVQTPGARAVLEPQDGVCCVAVKTPA